MNSSSEKKTFEQLAQESGLAISIIDASLHEVFIANNNSICRSLNPSGTLSRACAAYCGKSLERVTATGKAVRFECHAGLECRAVPVTNTNAPLVAIIGRTFVKAENYRHATERAIDGDWKLFPPGELFENVLLTSSGKILDRTAKEVKEMVSRSKTERQAQIPHPETVLRPVAPELKLAVPSTKKTNSDFSKIVEKFNQEQQLDPTVVTRKLEPSPKQAPSAPEVGVSTPKPIPQRTSEERHQSEPRRIQARLALIFQLPAKNRLSPSTHGDPGVHSGSVRT